MDFKFISQGLWSKKQNILFQRKLEKEFWMRGHGLSASFSCLRLFPYLSVKIQNSFYACVKEGCSASLAIVKGG